LFCTKQQITVFDFSQNVGMIPAGETRTAGFEVSCDPDFIPGDSIEFIVITQAGEYQLLQTQEYYLGVEVESFESSNFHQFDWYFPFTTSWEISDQAIDGRYSACTPAMGNMSAQRLSIDFESNQDGYISFWFKTFTDQSNNGFFAFFINSYPAIFNFTGNNDWTRLETFVPAGLNQFNWNFFTHEASDSRLWIDNIVFPPRDYVAFSDQSNITSPEIQLYPNPFNPTVNIDFFLPEAGYIEISIFNIKGQKIKSLLADQLQSGRHSTVWSASDCRGNKVSSGVYFIQFNIDDKIDSIKKCLLLK
jgi:hypothetical protein